MSWTRSVFPLSGLGILLFAAACEDHEDRSQVARTDELQVSYDYALDLPARYTRQEVQGIDSKVEEFRSADTIVSTDFGYYSGPPSCNGSDPSCAIHGEQIAGRAALVALYRHGPDERLAEPKPFRVFVHVPVDGRLALNLFARCDTEEACDETLRQFREVRLFRQGRPTVQRDSTPPSLPARDQPN